MLPASSGPAAAFEQGAFFVAPNGRDTWSGLLPAPNASATDGPFETLAAAQLAMRSVHGRRVTYVRQGRYFLAAPIRFGEADSREVIIAYPGETPVLFGGLLVSEWHASEGGLFTSRSLTTSPDAKLPILIADGQRLPMARYPLVGSGDDHEAAWLFADSTPDRVDSHHSFRVRSGDVAVFSAASPGAVVTIFGKRGWQNYVLPIDRVDWAKRVITLRGKTWDALGEGSRFAVLNAAATPGSWRLDPASDTLQLRTADGASPPVDIVAAALGCSIVIKRAQDITLRGLQFVGSAAEGAAICLSGTQRIALDGLVITNTGDGIRLDHATDTRITNNVIAQTGGFGITLRDGSDGTVVADNWLHDIGWLHQDASAIWFEGSSRNRFARNRIERVAKFGIGGGSLTSGGSYDDAIEDNEIDRANLRTSDGGGIMVIGWSQDSTRDVIQRNIVSRTTALGNVGWDGKPHTQFQDPLTRLVSQAIYLDDWASDVLVSGNLICNNIGGIELHSGWDNRIVGNFLVGDSGIAISIDAQNWLGAGEHPHPMQNNSIEGNVVVLHRPSTGQSGIVAVAAGEGAATFADNLYAGPGLNSYSFHQTADNFWSAYSFGIDAWKRRGQDLGSIVGADAADVVQLGGAIRVIGPRKTPAPLSLRDIGRPQDLAGLLDRVRQHCGLP